MGRPASDSAQIAAYALLRDALKKSSGAMKSAIE
jgi:hypothetical protein